MTEPSNYTCPDCGEDGHTGACADGWDPCDEDYDPTPDDYYDCPTDIGEELP